ncbi:MAG: class I SAM-dependent methyltransferase [Opitutaceae bacterium]|nr:class I SAM-dependent methyltransferase [Opitutaceae bacterium]
MTRPLKTFGRLTRLYQLLEVLAFGNSLAKARFAFLPDLSHCRKILILGEGDGRFLLQLHKQNPTATIECIDLSAKMLAKAKERLHTHGNPETLANLHFRQADIRDIILPENTYDAIITLFFLDCFNQDSSEKIISKMAPSLQSGGHWYWADFRQPAKGWRAFRARIWLAMLYQFFRWQTNIEATHIVPTESILKQNKLILLKSINRQAGLIRTTLFQKESKKLSRPD